MNRSFPRLSPALILPVTFAVACLGAGLLLGLAARLPAEAEDAFGAPAAGLPRGRRLLLAAQLLGRERALTTPLDPQAAPQEFVVELGESTYAITNRLERQGLVGDAELLRTFLIYSGQDTRLQAGEYTLSAGMTPLEIALVLQDPTPHEVDFRILAGWRLEEIAAALPTSGLAFSPQAFLEYAYRPGMPLPDFVDAPAGASLEGFLYPQNYRLGREASIEQLTAAALQSFQANIGPDILEGFEAQGLSVFEAVTLASMIQREAVVEEEMPLIASVFLNRRAAGMRMDSDPTVQYALGDFAGKGSWWKNPLSLEDLQVASPYNTYQVFGLPPGPICTPSLSAVRAAAFPAQSPYYYFRALCDGSGKHAFAESLEQHEANACR